MGDDHTDDACGFRVQARREGVRGETPIVTDSSSIILCGVCHDGDPTVSSGNSIASLVCLSKNRQMREFFPAFLPEVYSGIFDCFSLNAMGRSVAVAVRVLV